MEDRTDAELLAVSGEDPGAFRTLFERWSHELMAYFYRRTFDAEVAADLLAETFAIAYFKRHRFKPQGLPVGAWLYGIARRELSHYWRRRRAETRAIARLGVQIPAVDDESLARIEELADASGLRRELEAALSRLTEAERAAVQLRVVEDRPYREVAGELGCSEGAARVRVHRALRRMSAWLGTL